LQMNGVAAGIYNAKLSAVSGSTVANKVINYRGEASAQSIKLPAQTADGMYLLQVTDTSGKSTTIKVLVQKN